MKYQAVVWGLDGTLTDSAPGIMQSVRYALDKMNYPPLEENVLRKFLGPPLAESFQQFCGMSHEEAIQATHFYKEVYNQTNWKKNAVYPGIRPLLEQLKRQGCYLAVATGKPLNIAKKVLDYFCLSHLFERIIGPCETQYYAKKEDAIADALQGRKDAVMVGDRSMDVNGARVYGIPSIAVAYGYGSQEEFAQCQPDEISQTVQGLYPLLGVEQAERKGYFISIEGNDGCGKSTQADLLAKRLYEFGYDVLKTREPGGSPVSEKIRGILLDKENDSMCGMTESLLFAAARAQHVREIIRPALSRGQVVITDRFVDSSVAYQGAGQQLGEQLVSQINAPAVDGCYPDTTVYLDIDYQIAMKRRESASEVDRIEQFSDQFHERVQQSFKRLNAENPDRYLRVDANQDIQTIADTVFYGIMDRMSVPCASL